MLPAESLCYYGEGNVILRDNLTWTIYVIFRETREGWPLLTVETEVIGD
jgi:hypothetical protein